MSARDRLLGLHVVFDPRVNYQGRLLVIHYGSRQFVVDIETHTNRIFWNTLSEFFNPSGSAKNALCYHARCAVRERYEKLRAIHALPGYPAIMENLNGEVIERLEQAIDACGKRIIAARSGSRPYERSALACFKRSPQTQAIPRVNSL